MPTPSNHQNIPMPMAPPQGQPPSPFPHGFIGQGMAQVQPNSMYPHFDPSSQQMQMQLQFQMRQMQMQVHGFNSCVDPFNASGHAPQQPPPPGNGGDSQLQPSSGPLPNAHVFFQSNNISNPPHGPGPNTNTHLVLPAKPMQNPAPDHAPNNQMVALGIPIPDSTLGTGHSPHFPTQLQPNSLQNPALDPVPNNHMVSLGIPMPNSGLGPGQLPHLHSYFQPNSPQMSNNNNMDVATQQFIMSQQLMAAAAAVMQNPALVQAFSCLQGFQNCFPSAPVPPLQTNNRQTMSPHCSSPTLQTHTSSLPCSVPPMPSHPPPRNLMMPITNTQLSNGVSSNKQPSYPQPNNNIGTAEHAHSQAQVPSQQFSSHHTQPATHFTSAPLPSGQRPLFLPNPVFPPSLEQSAQAFAPGPYMGQNIAEMQQMAPAHLAGNIPFQVSAHQQYQQLQQAQHIMQPGKLQRSKRNSNEQDGVIRNSCITNDMQQFQNGACDGGLSSRIGGSRGSPHNGRWADAGEPYPKWKIESSGLNSSQQADGRAKIRSPLSHFPPNRMFNNGPSRFQKDVAGGTRSPTAALICKNCERSFNSRLCMEEHLNCHVKCDEENCSFEASEKVLKEHKLIHHMTQSLQRAAPLKSKESVLEIQQWRDERKKHYPTEANVKRKAQQMQERRARGELIDEDSKIRRQRMKEILAKQAELGLQVAEVPSHYISDGPFYQKGHHKSGARVNYDSFGKPNKSDNSAMKIPRINDLTSPRSVLNHLSSFKIEQPQEEGGTAIPIPEILGSEVYSLSLIPEKDDKNCKTKDSASQVAISTEDISLNKGQKSEKCQKICKFFQHGRCLKGQRCTFRHAHRANDTRKGAIVASELPTRITVPSKLPKRKPTLLEKLLSGEIKKEKSHLLQIFRFMVNNSFLTEWPNEPLKFFQWSREASNPDPEQAERPYLSYLNSTYGIDEGHTDLDELDATKRVPIGEMESSSDDHVETDLDEADVKEKVSMGEINIGRDGNLEEGEIEEGEIV
ncbi:hypothetical protein KI387_039524 [Taxus chinensis]|uniref:C3H1-type domain-containing protein n=1 Tax=Taxus chinensis TaxID=29808 RepID=A0AA38CAV7_TAXCH|nr:hypothetical protein KI387_039524 [Taxus chinensis]